MKIRKFLFTLLLLFVATIRAGAENDALQLTFHRSGNDVGSVAVTVAGHNLPSTVSASLVSTSFDALKTAGAAAITNGSVLAPNAYANGEGSQISYLFLIEGLPTTFTYNAVELDVYALTAGGTAQGNTGTTVRYFQFEAATGSTSQLSLFAAKAVDTDICTVPDQKDGLYHSLQTLKAETAATATSPLYLQVTLTKTSAQGCYAGIGMVRLCTADDEEKPVEDEPFSADKVYTIHRNNNTSAYIYQEGNHMGAGSLNSEKRFWWTLEPTGNPDCYYIRNVTTGDYVQSARQELSTLVPMGKEPVEFQIKKDPTPGAATSDFYYMASTDQEISVATDGTLGLNFGAPGIVAYYIRTGRGNSYWQIEESEYGYQPRTVETTDFARSLQLYSVPCGSLGTAYLSQLLVEGTDVLSPLHYEADAPPTEAHTIYTGQKVIVRQGGKLPVSVVVANDGEAIQTLAYVDWDKDGVFEQTLQLAQGTGVFTLPASVAVGLYRMRIRVTETATQGPEDDVIGACYDFVVSVVPASTSLTWSVETNDPQRGTAEGMEVEGMLRLKAEAKGNATFLGWKRMDGYSSGPIIATEAEAEIPLTQNMRLVALFSPNTQEETDGLILVPRTPVAQPLGVYDLTGRPISTRAKGIIIANGKKQIINP